jgi:hypothetical protein
MAFSIVAVIYWALSESWGRGDLRPYGFIRVLAIVLVPTIVLIYRETRWNDGLFLIAWFVLYCLAIIFENQDASIFSLQEIMSGHTLKHLFSAASYAVVAVMLAARVAGTGSGGSSGASPHPG